MPGTIPLGKPTGRHRGRASPARKVTIIDAFRSLARLPVARPFSLELMRAEFENQLLDAHFFFSSHVGKQAFELKEAHGPGAPSFGESEAFDVGFRRFAHASAAHHSSGAVGRY